MYGNSQSHCNLLKLSYMCLLYLFGYKTGFSPLKNDPKSVIRNFVIIQILPFLNNPKYLDLSYKTDLDFWHGLGRKNLRLITEEIWYIRRHRILQLFSLGLTLFASIGPHIIYCIFTAAGFTCSVVALKVSLYLIIMQVI